MNLLSNKLFTSNPNQYLLYNKVGLPVKSNIIEVNGRFELKNKVFRGIISELSTSHTLDWLEDNVSRETGDLDE